jgi:hypothetical protein
VHTNFDQTFGLSTPHDSVLEEAGEEFWKNGDKIEPHIRSHHSRRIR